MTHNKTTLSILMAGLLASGAALAQYGGAAPTSDVPVKAGEASTVTQGVPNVSTNNPSVPHSTMGASGTHMGTTSATGMPVHSSTGAAVVTPSTATMGAAPATLGEGRYVPAHSATVTSNVPTKAGEASTMTNGVPNMVTQNANPDMGRLVLPSETTVSRVPMRAGEASTMVNGRPNWNPNDPVLSR